MGTVWVLSDGRYLSQRMPSALLRELDARSVRHRTLVAEEIVQVLGRPGDTAQDPWRDLRPGDVVLARTRNRAALTVLRTAARPGVQVLTPATTVAAVRDKACTAQVLAARGIPTPVTYLVDSPAALHRLPADRFPLLLKPHAGDNARGIVLVREPADLDELAWTDSMALAQEYVECGAVDLKVYAAGGQVWAVRRPSPLHVPGRSVPAGMQRVPVGRELHELVTACGAAFGLELFGVDVLETSRGPLVVDVNEFPNYTGIDEAPAAIADLVVAALRQQAVAA